MGEAVEGRRRAPEKSVLHEAFRRGWPDVSNSMPSRVKLEVERYLTCGDARFGFVEVTCETCAERRARRPRPVSPNSAQRFLLGCCLQPPLPAIAPRRVTLSEPLHADEAVPPCLRRQALATPENRLPRRPSSPTSTSASDPSSDPPLPICGLNHLFFAMCALPKAGK